MPESTSRSSPWSHVNHASEVVLDGDTRECQVCATSTATSASASSLGLKQTQEGPWARRSLNEVQGGRRGSRARSPQIVRLFRRVRSQILPRGSGVPPGSHLRAAQTPRPISPEVVRPGRFELEGEDPRGLLTLPAAAPSSVSVESRFEGQESCPPRVGPDDVVIRDVEPPGLPGAPRPEARGGGRARAVGCRAPPPRFTPRRHRRRRKGPVPEEAAGRGAPRPRAPRRRSPPAEGNPSAEEPSGPRGSHLPRRNWGPAS